MKKVFIILFFGSLLYAQTFTVEKFSGDVKYQNSGSESWLSLTKGTILDDDAIISTGEKSLVVINGKNIRFTLNELSAVSVSSIKKMDMDDLLLALAMEDMLNAPKEIEKSSDNTATYGTKEVETNVLQIKSDDFGVKRLNGAVQLAESGMEESAVVAAMETYRKYPDTKQLPECRIYFANILNEKGLYQEALDEYVDIQKLKLSDVQKTEVNDKIESINMKLLNE